jgi:hypothetical protein
VPRSFPTNRWSDGNVQPPDPTKPVLFTTSRYVWFYRYGAPLLLVALFAVLLAKQPIEVPGRNLHVFLLPALLVAAPVLVQALKVRRASVTEEGVIVGEHGGDTFLRWTDIDWATEVWTKNPTLVVRVKRDVPGASSWFLLVPPRTRRWSWKAQPMSEYVAERVRETRAAHPERALQYTPWPSRAALTLKVMGAMLLLLAVAILLSLWLAGMLPTSHPVGAGEPIQV